VIAWMFRQCWLSLAPSYSLIELYNNQSSMTAIAGVSKRSPDFAALDPGHARRMTDIRICFASRSPLPA
jgi:hypothetical protein